jgi:hypothetical protein
MKLFFKSKKGITLPIAVMIVAVVFLFVATVLTLNENLTRNVSHKVDTEDALQIAEAGYNHYMYYLNQDSTFFMNPTGINKTKNGEQIGFKCISYDADGLPIEYERTAYMRGNEVIGYYEIRLIQPGVNEDLAVISTGYRADNEDVKKTVQVKIHQRSFAEYVDFSDRSGNVWWTSTDKAEGPVFCNGDLNISGSPEFFDDVIIGGKVNLHKDTSNNPIYHGLLLTEQPKMLFPATNEDIISWGRSSDGLRFQGRTCILLMDNKVKTVNKVKNADGTYSEVVGIFSLPKCGVLLVENDGSNIGDVFISGTLDGRLTVYAQGDVYITGRDPTNMTASGTLTPPSNTTGSSSNEGGIYYKDTNIPRKNDTGKNFTDDMLGIIAEGDIIIATRTWPATNAQGHIYDEGKEGSISVKNIKVYGALMTNTKDKQIKVEEYDDIGVKGDFTVYGSKIQNAERGPVGTFQGNRKASGYSKINVFDYRLKNQSPPHFVTPEKSGWEVKSWDEIPNPTSSP